jgi:hypothetical protein
MRTLNFTLWADEFTKAPISTVMLYRNVLSRLDTKSFQSIDCCVLTNECDRYLILTKVVSTLPRKGNGSIDILFGATIKNFISYESISLSIILWLIAFLDIFSMILLDGMHGTTTTTTTKNKDFDPIFLVRRLTTSEFVKHCRFNSNKSTN